METTDGVHGLPDGAPQPSEPTTPPAAEPTPTPGGEPAPTEPGTTDAPAEPTAPEDNVVLEGDTPEPNVEINPTDGETGPVVDNQQGDPTGLPAESYEADPSDDKALPHDQDQA